MTPLARPSSAQARSRRRQVGRGAPPPANGASDNGSKPTTRAFTPAGTAAAAELATKAKRSRRRRNGLLPHVLRNSEFMESLRTRSQARRVRNRIKSRRDD
jgi:hypothetical protein